MPKSDKKVIEFDPNRKRKLKTLNYVSPEKKEMLRQREIEKNKKLNRMRTIKSVSTFLLICAAIYVLLKII